MAPNNEKQQNQNDGELNTMSSSTPDQAEPNPKTEAVDSEQAVMPHAASSAIQVAEEVAKGVRTVITEAVAWVEEKAGEMTEKQDTGPYDSPGTCAPSDLDVIATGILPAMPSQESRNDSPTNDASSEEGKK